MQSFANGRWQKKKSQKDQKYELVKNHEKLVLNNSKSNKKIITCARVTFRLAKVLSI